MKIRFFHVVIVAIIALAVWYGGSAEQSQPISAAKRGMQWLLNYTGTYENPGVYWALREINTSTCKSDALSNVIEGRFTEHNPDAVFHAYASLFSGEHSIDTLDVSQLETYDRWLISALQCHGGRLDASVLGEILSTEKKGYDLTHQFVAIRYARHSRCDLGMSEQDIELFERTIAEEIAHEDANTGHLFNDLSAERAALLLWAGYNDQVDEEWIRIISANQSRDGGWSNGSTDTSNTHTTALATWALVLWTKRCPYSVAL